MEKDRTINKLKEEMNNYQEKLNSSYNYPIYSPLAKKSEININLADDKNNNISQIINNEIKNFNKNCNNYGENIR